MQSVIVMEESFQYDAVDTLNRRAKAQAQAQAQALIELLEKQDTEKWDQADNNHTEMLRAIFSSRRDGFRPDSVIGCHTESSTVEECHSEILLSSLFAVVKLSCSIYLPKKCATLL